MYNRLLVIKKQGLSERQNTLGYQGFTFPKSNRVLGMYLYTLYLDTVLSISAYKKRQPYCSFYCVTTKLAAA